VAIESAETFDNPNSGGRITMRESWRDNDGSRVVIDRVFPAGTGKADAHVHLDFTQTFEVVSGTVELELDGDARTLEPGDKIEIPIGTAHRDLWNEGPGKLAGRLTIEPVPRFVEMYAETWLDSYAKGETNDQDEMSLLQILVIAQASDGQSFAAGPPRWLQKATLPLVAAIGPLAMACSPLEQVTPSYVPSFKHGWIASRTSG